MFVGNKTVEDGEFMFAINAKQVYLAGALALSFKSGSLKTNRLAHKIFFNVSLCSRHDSLS